MDANENAGLYPQIYNTQYDNLLQKIKLKEECSRNLQDGAAIIASFDDCSSSSSLSSSSSSLSSSLSNSSSSSSSTSALAGRNEK